MTGDFREAVFVEKHNRFVGTVFLEGRRERVYIPNTGRLAELLLPGTSVVLTPVRGKYRYKIEFIMSDGKPVMIDSVKGNAIFHRLLMEGKVPGLECRVLRREPAVGSHRFDFELETPSGLKYLELKSCTLFHGDAASFPDAVSARAAAHVRALAATGRGMLVFFILGQGIRRFFPNYHTDYEFYRILLEHRDRIDIRAYSARYDGAFGVTGLGGVRVQYPEAGTGGSYLLVLRNARARRITVGMLGSLRFPAGHYVYAGSGMGGVHARIARHRRKGKRLFWHIDYLTEEMSVAADIPIVGTERLECRLAADMRSLGGEVVKGFGSSDCSCAGHLFRFTQNPLHLRELWQRVMEYRFGGPTQD
ncbi:MAG: DNA/RNA nuclease SfsA [Spirochaetes bacterium]|nr:DNA/RNA nuclease SfsA [Spirochaetota bacterium]